MPFHQTRNGTRKGLFAAKQIQTERNSLWRSAQLRQPYRPALPFPPKTVTDLNLLRLWYDIRRPNLHRRQKEKTVIIKHLQTPQNVFMRGDLVRHVFQTNRGHSSNSILLRSEFLTHFPSSFLPLHRPSSKSDQWRGSVWIKIGKTYAKCAFLCLTRILRHWSKENYGSGSNIAPGRCLASFQKWGFKIGRFPFCDRHFRRMAIVPGKLRGACQPWGFYPFRSFDIFVLSCVNVVIPQTTAGRLFFLCI